MHMRVLAIGFLASAGWGPRARRAWTQARVRVRAMRMAARTRRLLSGMDARMLRDIGIGPADAREEAGRWPWDLGPPRR
jgi:uncharacterized protein YjiS (DUF1127 family)